MEITYAHTYVHRNTSTQKRRRNRIEQTRDKNKRQEQNRPEQTSDKKNSTCKCSAHLAVHNRMYVCSYVCIIHALIRLCVFSSNEALHPRSTPHPLCFRPLPANILPDYLERASVNQLATIHLPYDLLMSQPLHSSATP